jgi:2-C-methyl-D-erythritol 4-phosphate cytidylyltransferase
MRFVSVIVLAAGKGERLKSRVSKPLVKIGNMPLLTYSLKAFAYNRRVNEIIVVVNQANAKAVSAMLKGFRPAKIKKVILGGRRRQDSVNNGLRALDARAELVVIHDAARPFVSREIVNNTMREAFEGGAAITAVPVKATIKEVSGDYVKKTLERSSLWEIQTPQIFRRNLIQQAYEKFAKADVTDDAMLVERLGVKPRVVFGSYMNIKVTTPEDLIIAEAIAKKWKTA